MISGRGQFQRNRRVRGKSSLLYSVVEASSATLVLLALEIPSAPAQEPSGNQLFKYPDTLVSGTVSAELSMSAEQCRKICVTRPGCAGFDYTADVRSCRIFANIASARSNGGSSAETRSLINGYRDPTNPPRNWAGECEAEAAPKIAGRGVLFDKISARAIEVCREAAIRPSARPETWAADQGEAAGLTWLGLMYRQGYAASRDYMHLYRLATEQGRHADADAVLAQMYRERGATRDDTEAIRLFRLAAEQGDVKAQAFLAEAYLDGRGVVQDEAKAFRLARLAAGRDPAVRLAESREAEYEILDRLVASRTSRQDELRHQ